VNGQWLMFWFVNILIISVPLAARQNLKSKFLKSTLEITGLHYWQNGLGISTFAQRNQLALKYAAL
jgi:hypothetical protein